MESFIFHGTLPELLAHLANLHGSPTDRSSGRLYTGRRSAKKAAKRYDWDRTDYILDQLEHSTNPPKPVPKVVNDPKKLSQFFK